MAKNFRLSYKLVDNKIPCGGFNLLGGGIKGKDISLVRQLNGIASVDKATKQHIHLLFLNENDLIKILEGVEKSQTGAVPPIDNIRLFEIDYTDLISYQINFTDFQQQALSGEIFVNDDINGIRYFFNHFVPQYAGNNGKAMNLYDICNWYSLPLGFTVTGIYTSTDQTPYADVYQDIDHILESFYDYLSPDDILSMIEESTVLENVQEIAPMKIKILLEQSYPDSNPAPASTTTSALIFTPEGNRFYFPDPVG